MAPNVSLFCRLPIVNWNSNWGDAVIPIADPSRRLLRPSHDEQRRPEGHNPIHSKFTKVTIRSAKLAKRPTEVSVVCTSSTLLPALYRLGVWAQSETSARHLCHDFATITFLMLKLVRRPDEDAKRVRHREYNREI